MPNTEFVIEQDAFLNGELRLVQRIENRASGIASLLEHARTELATAQQTITDAEQRIGQPFRHATALTEAQREFARIETQLAAMQHDFEPDPSLDPAQQLTPPPTADLTVETVRTHRPALGVRDLEMRVGTLDDHDEEKAVRTRPSCAGLTAQRAVGRRSVGPSRDL